MPRGVYPRKPRQHKTHGLSHPGGEPQTADPVQEAIANNAQVDTTTGRQEVIRLLRLERERFINQAKVVEMCLKVLEGLP